MVDIRRQAPTAQIHRIAGPLGERLGHVAVNLQLLQRAIAQGHKAGKTLYPKRIRHDIEAVLMELQQVSPRSPDYAATWQHLSKIFEQVEKLPPRLPDMRACKDFLRRVEAYAINVVWANAVEVPFPSFQDIERAECTLQALAQFAPHKEFRSHALGKLQTLQSRMGMLPPPTPTPTATAFAVPPAIVDAELYALQAPAFVQNALPRLSKLAQLPPDVAIWHNDVEDVAPAVQPPPPTESELYNHAYDTLMGLRKILKDAAHDGIGDERQAALLQSTAKEISRCTRRIGRLEPFNRNAAEHLWSCYRSLIHTAFDAVPDTFDQVLSEGCDPLDDHDASYLDRLDDDLRAGHFADPDDLRKVIAPMQKYGTEATRGRATELLERLDELFPSAQAGDTKKTWNRDEVYGITLPEGMNKIIELRSASGKTFYTTETLGRGTYGKYRIAVDQDGKRWGIKVLRLQGEAADTFRAARINKDGNLWFPTAAVPRAEADEEIETVRSFSEHLDVADVLEIGGKLYAVMTPMEDELLQVNTSIPDLEKRRAVVEYASYQLANELGALHAKGRVHGDLKPENVLVSGDGRVAASDFGGSKEWSEQAGPRPFYDSISTYPPPGAKDGWGPDADMWALGTLVATMLDVSGTSPFNFRNFNSEKQASYVAWYGKLPRSLEGRVLVEQLPQATRDDRAWSKYFAPMRETSVALCELVLRTLLNPDPDARWSSETLVNALTIKPHVVSAAQDALKEMALSGDKEAKYKALESFSTEHQLWSQFTVGIE